MRLPRPLTLPHSEVAHRYFLRWGRSTAGQRFSGRALHALAVGVLPAMFLLRSTREEIYNILWALVFGFATLNILSLGARRFEQEKSGLNFGEILAILVVRGVDRAAGLGDAVSVPHSADSPHAALTRIAV